MQKSGVIHKFILIPIFLNRIIRTVSGEKLAQDKPDLLRKACLKKSGLSFELFTVTNFLVMAVDGNLQFIRERIYEIRSAVMYSMSEGVVKLPNSIVSVVKVDDEGNIWFVCSPPLRRLEASECVFPARLHFYRKGISFHVEVSGAATIINQEFSENKTIDKPLLIRMSMTNVQYCAVAEKKPKSKMEILLTDTYKWLLRTVAIPRQDRSILSKLS